MRACARFVKALTVPGHRCMTGRMLIYKVFRAEEWATLQATGDTAGAPIDLADGYVHFSTAEQLRETASKHFGGVADLMLLALDPEVMGPDLRWEPSRGGALFPHLYRKLRLDEVLWAKPMPLSEAGHRFPDDLP